MKLWNHQLLLDGKPHLEPFSTRDAAVTHAREKLAKEIAARRVQIIKVEARPGAAERSMQNRRDRIFRKAGWQNEAHYAEAWAQGRIK